MRSIHLRNKRNREGTPEIVRNTSENATKAEQCVEYGNPAYFHTYPDESFNRTVKRLGVGSHPLRFCYRVLGKARVLRVRSRGASACDGKVCRTRVRTRVRTCTGI